MLDNKLVMEKYQQYLTSVRKASDNTRSSYLSDIRQLEAYLSSESDADLTSVTENHLLMFLDFLREEGKSPSTLARNIASWKNFYSFLVADSIIEDNPAKGISADKFEHKVPEILTNKEVELLLQQPKATDNKGLRDKAMLEVMYATGIRVSELIDLNVSDVIFSSNSIRCFSKNRERFIPMYPYAMSVLKNYMEHGRPSMIKPPDTDALFVNMKGARLTRQGFWKIIKYYQAKANIKKDITPHMLRHSFAAHLLQNGADLYSVQKMMGHSDISSTLFYMQLVPNSLREIYKNSHPRA